MLAILLFGAAPASAATFVVNTTADTIGGGCSGSCSLREAVQAANLDATTDTILLPAGTLQLERFGLDDANQKGDLDVTRPVIIRGAGAGVTTIHATGQDRVLDVFSTDLTLAGLTVSGGIATGESGSNDDGGGIRAKGSGTLELDGVVIRDNLAQGEASTALGGGIYEEAGRLIARNSAILANTARSSGFGGGIAVGSESATLSLINVTIAQNHANFVGGGIFFNQSATAELAFVTVIENEASLSGGAFGASADKARIRSSIVAHNQSPSGPDCEASGEAPGSLGGNVGPAVCGFTLASDSQADPTLAPITGAGVPVAEPLAGSPAIDRGVAPCPATDARGVLRPQGGGCDSGAAERPVAAGPPAPAPAPNAGPAVRVSSVSVSRTKFRAGPKVAAARKKGDPPTGTTISFKLSGSATVKASVRRLVRGRNIGGKCLPATPAREGRVRCTRRLAVGSLKPGTFPAGRSAIDFSGRTGGQDLAPGRYDVQFLVTSSGSTAATPTLRIVP